MHTILGCICSKLRSDPDSDLQEHGIESISMKFDQMFELLMGISVGSYHVLPALTPNLPEQSAELVAFLA